MNYEAVKKSIALKTSAINPTLVIAAVGRNRVEARENIDRRLFYPVIDFKIRNSFKFLYVIGNQDATRRKRMSGNKHIE